ncbi:MAG: creatininase family protein [Chloroflexi bacterium]|nr:creatininase family protein [Chloroflexota bacterium]
MSKWAIPPLGGHLDRASGLYFQNMTGKQVQKRLKSNDLVIIPLGSTEAHGPHAPYGEDTFLVTRMAEQVAEATGCTISQPLWFGSHPYHHVGMPGTIVVPEEYFVGMVKAVMAGFWNAGFRKQILLNGHGQEYVIPTAMHQFAKTFQVPGIFVNVNWYHAVQDYFKTKAEGGPYETPFIHADEVETSWTLALLPEYVKQEDAEDTQPYGFLPEGHIDKAGNLLHRPIAWYGQVGCGPIEVAAYKPGVVGRATLADVEKARAGVQALLDYLEKLVTDILQAFPAGKLPPAEQVSMRPPEELEAITKQPFEEGWRHLYTLAWPF